MGKALNEVLIFKLFRAETITGTVTSPPIAVILDIIKPRHPHYFPAGKTLSVGTFQFQRMKEVFHAALS